MGLAAAVGTGQSLAAGWSRAGAGRAGGFGPQLPRSGSHFPYEAKPVRGVSTSHAPPASALPLPCPRARHTHRCLHTTAPRGPNTGCWPEPFLHGWHSPAQPSPGCCRGTMQALQRFASYKTLGPGTHPAQRGWELAAVPTVLWGLGALARPEQEWAGPGEGAALWALLGCGELRLQWLKDACQEPRPWGARGPLGQCGCSTQSHSSCLLPCSMAA